MRTLNTILLTAILSGCTTHTTCPYTGTWRDKNANPIFTATDDGKIIWLKDGKIISQNKVSENTWELINEYIDTNGTSLLFHIELTVLNENQIALTMKKAPPGYRTGSDIVTRIKTPPVA